MKMSAQEFMGQPQRAVTLVGMSGVGKSYLSAKLAGWGWDDYSCDYLIGAEYLKDLLGSETLMQADNIAALSEFVGQVGDIARGGMALQEFQRRQRLYYEAEVQSLVDARDAIAAAEGDFVLDSSGSICEIEDEGVLEALGQDSLFVYLKVRQEGHGDILARAVQYPKPLYFPPSFLMERLASYQRHFDVDGVEQVDPLAFLRWVFPFLFEARLGKYQRLADAYGVTIYSDRFNGVESQEDFLAVIEEALEKRDERRNMG
jgi:hypothetical protein